MEQVLLCLVGNLFTFFFYLLHLSVKKRRIAVAFKGMSQRSIYPEQNTITMLSATPKNRHFSFSKSELQRPEGSRSIKLNGLSIFDKLVKNSFRIEKMDKIVDSRNLKILEN